MRTQNTSAESLPAGEQVNEKWAAQFATKMTQAITSALPRLAVQTTPEVHDGRFDETQEDVSYYEQFVGREFFKLLPNGQPDKTGPLYAVTNMHPQWGGAPESTTGFRLRFSIDQFRWRDTTTAAADRFQVHRGVDRLRQVETSFFIDAKNFAGQYTPASRLPWDPLPESITRAAAK